MTETHAGTPGSEGDASIASDTPAPAACPMPVVGIGASAGGVEAILQVLAGLSEAPGAAFVVAMHLAPDQPSNAAAVFQSATRMPVTQVDQPMPLQADHVYLIAPGTILTVSEGRLELEAATRRPARPVAIDKLFESLAAAYRERAVAVVLSGTGTDGTLGARHIRAQGGIVLAQRPADSKHSEMPQSAIDAQVVDLTLDAVAIAGELERLWRGQRALPAAPDANEDSAKAPAASDAPGAGQADAAGTDAQAVSDILLTLRTRTNHDFRHYKRPTVLRRIQRRMHIHALTCLADYRDMLDTDRAEAQALLQDMLIGVTGFFRDTKAFAALEQTVVPRLFEHKDENEQVRAWVAGCSTGEEAYSIAMLLHEQLDRLEGRARPGIQVFATDIDERAIALARAGHYSAASVDSISPARMRQFFLPAQHGAKINKQIRESMLFALHNVLRDPPFSRLDLISCRNLLIYLDRDAQRQALETFHFALQPNGYLLLGGSESADGLERLFVPVDKRQRIYQAKAVARSSAAPYRRVAQQPPAALPTPGAARHGAAVRPFTFAGLHQRVLEQYAPPSVIINEAGDVVHMSEHAGRFLRYVGGEPTRNLLALVHPPLRTELQAALYQAVRTGRSVEARRVRLASGDGQAAPFVNMTVRPFREPSAGASFVLVLFDEVQDAIADFQLDAAAADAPDGLDAVIKHMEDELRFTRDQLQITIEESEASGQELKASNEELQAMNEELRSATEELEASKEEAQSINEELVTLNAELRERIEEAAKVSDDLLNLISATEIASLFVDRQMRIKRYTPKVVELFNIIPTDLGRPLLDLTHRLQYPALADDARSAFETLGTVEREVCSVDNRWFLTRVAPYRTVDDRIDGAVVTFVDITARRAAEQRARDSIAKLQLAAQSTRDYAIIVQDPLGRVVSWNSGAERLFGYAASEMVGQSADAIFSAPDREQGVPAAERARASREGRAEDQRWMARKNGTLLYCSGIMTPVASSDFQGFAKISQDLTAQREAEHLHHRQLTQERSSREQAEVLMRAKDDFLAMVSHELKNPLNMIQLKAETLLRSKEAQESPDILDGAMAIVRAVGMQGRIIDDLLDLSRLRTGKLALAAARINLRAIAMQVIAAFRQPAAQRGLQLGMDSASPDCMAWADPVRVEQILWNLVGNAVKFTSRGGHVLVGVTVDADWARIRVEDDGEGIDPGALAHIFDMFRQGSDARRHAGQGLGIGLSLVRQLVELQGGTVSAASAGLGRGACFTVTLPLQPVLAQGAGGRAAGPLLAGVRILLVDDNLDLLDALSALLKAEGAVVRVAAGAASALMAAETDDFDVLITDIQMPGMNGYALLKALRALPRTARLPAIACTGLSASSDPARAAQAGFDAFLTKPLKLDQLVQAIRRVCAAPAQG